jgi:hypothetical protein
MCAVAASARDQLDMTGEQKRRTFGLYCHGHRLHTIYQCSLISLGKTEQHSGDIPAFESRIQ